MRTSMEWMLEDNMVDGLFFCATLAGSGGGHTPTVQAGGETPDTRAVTVKPDPRCFWEGHSGWVPVSRMKMLSLVGLSTHSAFHWWPTHGAVRLSLSDEMMSCYAAGTNGCLDLRHRASALDGQVSAEWSRCPGSMTLRARESMSPLRRISASWMLARMGRLSAGVGHRHPVTIRKASLMAE